MNEEFVSSLRKMLIDAGVSKNKVEKLIAKQKYEYVKQASLKIIDKIREHIKSDELDEAEEMLENSPAGDGYGCNNDYLNFISVFNNDEDKLCQADIGYIIYTMKILKDIIDK